MRVRGSYGGAPRKKRYAIHAIWCSAFSLFRRAMRMRCYAAMQRYAAIAQKGFSQHKGCCWQKEHKPRMERDRRRRYYMLKEVGGGNRWGSLRWEGKGHRGGRVVGVQKENAW